MPASAAASHHGLAAGGRDRRVDVHPRRRRAHHALRLRARAVAAAQAAHRRHQVERAAPRHGDVGRDRGRGRGRVPGRHLGQDAGRRHDHAHGDEAADASTRSWRPTCTPTSCRTSPPRWPARSASRPPRTSTPSAPSLRCSSRSTVRPSTSSARASPIPIGTFWSAVMMLEHLGEPAAARRLMRAIERVTADKRFHTPDLGGIPRIY